MARQGEGAAAYRLALCASRSDAPTAWTLNFVYALQNQPSFVRDRFSDPMQGVQIGNQIMPVSSQSSSGPAPIFGVLSVAAPFLGVLMTMVLASLFRPGHEEALRYAGIFFIVSLISMPFGALFAINALKRRERYRALGWIALPLNILPLLVYVFHAITPS